MKFKEWVQLHRLHHKPTATDTDLDPHNINRGFWFAHVGWLLLPKSPKVEEALKKIDLRDLQNDPLIQFCDKYVFSLL